jgi:hypothetical protein
MITLDLTDDFLEESFSLFGIRTVMEDYSLAYHLNHQCGLRLQKELTEVKYKNTASFPLFQWENEREDVCWQLFTNKITVKTATATSLFSELETEVNYYLLPEHKRADYFLKIETEDQNLISEAYQHLLQIPKIVTAYQIEIDQLKSVNNIIF